MTVAVRTAKHEAAHTAIAVMRGILPTSVTATPIDDAAGRVTLTRPDDDRDMALLVLAGVATEKREGWPPPWPRPDSPYKDERQLFVLAKGMKLDQRGWDELCREAERLTHQPDYLDLAIRLEVALEKGETLDADRLRQILGAERLAKYGIRREDDMEHLELKATTRTTDQELGQFAAIAAAYSIDRQREQIVEGAFTETIARWRESGKTLPLHYDHNGSADHVIGSVNPDTMGEIEGQGLFIEGKLDIHDSEVAREAWRSMRNGAMSLSIGYMVSRDHKRSDGVRELHSIDLFEVSLVPIPANADTRVISMKSETAPQLDPESDLQIWEKAQWRETHPVKVATFSVE